MKANRGAVGARRRPNRITSLRQPNTSRTRLRRITRACVSWGGWTRLASITTTIAAVTALWFTSQSLHATNDQYSLARQTALTERFSKAVEQLGNPGLDIRLGGIYSLERLTKDSPQDRASIFEVLSAFVRTHSPDNADCGKLDGPDLPVDIQSVLTVIGRRTAGGPESIDLRGACLSKADLSHANLQRTNLTGANLTRAQLDKANLNQAELSEAMLPFASLCDADLTQALLSSAHLKDADFSGAAMVDTQLPFADLQGAQFMGADLTDAMLHSADLRDAHFAATPGTVATAGTDMKPHMASVTELRVFDAKLTRTDVGDAKVDAGTWWPDGYVPRLQEINSDGP
ncbi:pentapeptide repeat-containing protein [Nocardia sp. CDC153]|uniref:pentapeptide repeat-containing protein n=1 Tax=Nocardia sp. CDC153 TaxID=3112167 RepID=UPI002DBC0FDD|nr:pentapeptide repeat-containing protein [Nocardia sp. CDC153]MEC3956484.1 pentapeptide repeat-containing protein [Nocardia sp. CDC153]